MSEAMHARRLLLVFILLCGLPLAAHAQSGVRRCTGAHGETVYTDKPCAAVDAMDRVPVVARASMPVTLRTGCARTLGDLTYTITSAIDGRDVNQLASVYHWAGMSTSAGYAVMRRLDGVLQRPLLDIAPVGGGSGDPVWRDDGSGLSVPVYPKARPPTALKVIQAIGKDGASTSTTFALRRNFDCWWISY